MKLLYHFSSSPGPRNDHRPGLKFGAYCATRAAFSQHSFLLFFILHEHENDSVLKLRWICSLFLATHLHAQIADWKDIDDISRRWRRNGSLFEKKKACKHLAEVHEILEGSEHQIFHEDVGWDWSPTTS